MENLQVFANPEFGDLEVWMKDGKPMFPAIEAAEVLGYINPRKAIIDHCLEDGVTNRDVIDTLGRHQQKKYITDGNLYRLIARSKLPAARRFERWVFDEVLPSIRVHGVYATPQTLEAMLNDPDTLITTLQTLKAERAARQQLEARVEQERPKVIFADSVAASTNTILVGDLAKLLKQNGVDIGQKRLFERLRQEGYLMRSGRENMPTQRAMEQRLFEIHERAINNPDGTIRTTRTVKVTGKGQFYFMDRYAGETRARA